LDIGAKSIKLDNQVDNFEIEIGNVVKITKSVKDKSTNSKNKFGKKRMNKLVKQTVDLE